MRGIFAAALCFCLAVPVDALPPWSVRSERFERAAARARQGELDGVLALGRDQVLHHPDQAGPRMALAQLLLRANDGVAAERAFRAAQERGAEPWSVILGLGAALRLQRRWQDVLATLPDAGPKPDLTATLLRERGTAELALARVTDAAATAEKAMDVAPDQADAWLLGAKLALSQGDAATAKLRIDTALRLRPDDVDALLLAATLTRRTADPEAISFLDHAVQIAPWQSSARLARARLLMDAGEDERALRDVDFVVANAPQNGNAFYLRAVLLARLGRYDEASTMFLRMGRFLGQFRRGLYHHATAEAGLGHTEIALDLANRYHARAPNDAEGIALLAQCHLAIGRPDMAMAVLEQALTSAQAVRSGGGTRTGAGQTVSCRAPLTLGDPGLYDDGLSTELTSGPIETLLETARQRPQSLH